MSGEGGAITVELLGMPGLQGVFQHFYRRNNLGILARVAP